MERRRLEAVAAVSVLFSTEDNEENKDSDWVRLINPSFASLPSV